MRGAVDEALVREADDARRMFRVRGNYSFETMAEVIEQVPRRVPELAGLVALREGVELLGRFQWTLIVLSGLALTVASKTQRKSLKSDCQLRNHELVFKVASGLQLIIHGCRQAPCAILA